MENSRAVIDSRRRSPDFCKQDWKRVIIERADIYYGSLILVNQTYPVHADISERKLKAPFLKQPNHQMQTEAAEALQALLFAVQAGNQIVGVSGYRTLAEQEQIWRDCEAANGLEYTRKYVAVPGHSEHQTGLAMDVAQNRTEIDFICPDFPYTGVCQEFRNLAPFYGFVERYPAGREHITGIGAEPWHFRYVGKPHAALMQEHHMVLEEYVEWIKGFPLRTRPLFCRIPGNEIFIGFIPFAREQTYCETALPQSYAYTISGNNADGVIVTAWEKKA